MSFKLFKIYFKDNEKLIKDIEEKRSYIKNLELVERNLYDNISDLKVKENSIKEKVCVEQNELHNIVKEKKNIISQEVREFEEKANIAKEEARLEYLNLLSELADDFNREQTLNQKEKKRVKESLNNLKKTYLNACRLEQENEKIKSKENFYKLQLTQNDLTAIKAFRQISDSFSNSKDKETVGKIIWKVYFEKATNEMISRVVGKNNVCGIYMITNNLNNKKYIGQSVDIGSRYKQHIKRGLGAEPASANKLYSSMKNDGLENFSFQVIQECSRQELSEKEKFWISHYETNIWGLNGNAGG